LKQKTFDNSENFFHFIYFNSMFKKFFSLLLALILFSAPQAFAQTSEYQVSLTGPESVELMDSVRVVLEVTDAGKPVSGIEPEITFDPGDAVSAEILYDCEDEEFYDHCKANHRGVAGLFEIHFMIEQSPVLVEAQLGSVIEGIRLNALEPASALEESSVVSSEITPAQVQAGPAFSFLFLVLPFLMLMSVVSFFVFSTTR
jgi:hypothetical protein